MALTIILLPASVWNHDFHAPQGLHLRGRTVDLPAYKPMHLARSRIPEGSREKGSWRRPYLFTVRAIWGAGLHLQIMVHSATQRRPESNGQHVRIRCMRVGYGAPALAPPSAAPVTPAWFARQSYTTCTVTIRTARPTTKPQLACLMRPAPTTSLPTPYHPHLQRQALAQSNYATQALSFLDARAALIDPMGAVRIFRRGVGSIGARL
ncbi:hypothetical protein K438DRAFT_1930494 [Mycena galopus ATCC 62051]|nr:hypothetical protein K438DRAFT_1930494 [Mycena galopus ATCC 62051]